MTAAELLAELRARGIELRTEGDRLHYSAPEGMLTPHLRTLLVECKEEIRSLLIQEAAERLAPRPIPRVAREGRLPLSFVQERMWFLHQLDPDSDAYQINAALRLEGPLDVDAVQSALERVIGRHEVLRTLCPAEDGRPTLDISDVQPVPLPVHDLSSLPQEQAEAAARRQISKAAARPMSLASGPMLRAELFRLDDRSHVLFLATHHFVADGWSMRILMQDLAALYTAIVNGEPPPLAELDVQYLDVAAWQRETLTDERASEQLAYWRTQLDGAPAALELPADRPRPPIQTFSGATASFTLIEALSRQLRELSRSEHATLFNTLLAAFQVLLSRHSGQKDVVVGTAVSLRNRGETEPLIGTFANNLPLRTDLSDDPSFRTLIGRVRDVTLAAYAHQDLPFEKLVDELQPQRDMSRNPLFQAAFILHQEALAESLALPGITVSEFPIDHHPARFDVTLDVVDGRSGLRGTLEYNTDLFRSDTMQRMAAHYRMLLESAADDPDCPLSRLPMLTAQQRQQILVDWNPTAADDFDSGLVHRLIQAQAETTPDRTAVVCGQERLTYRELNERANRLAHHLQKKGVKPDDLVALCVERTPEMLVTLLGILKAGGAYVPLDPTYPAKRLAFMLEDSEACVLVGDASLPPELADYPAEYVRVGTGTPEWDEECSSNPSVDVSPGNLAYVIYTSGSTGKPKGVQIEHGALANFLVSMRREPGITADDVLLAVTTLCFDISTLELLLPLMVGARVVLVDRDTAADGHQLHWEIKQHGVTYLQATPATWRILLKTGSLPSGLTALCGGEPLSAELAEALMEQSGRLWNMYGPTETTVWSTVERIRSLDRILIGRPIANTDVYVLDEHRQPVPVDVPGELYIGGRGLARGYLHRPELTGERFVPHPFRTEPGARLYRTGDLARWHADGRLECLGRIDHQVKIRGFRIELGEIEQVLGRHPQVRECLVVPRSEEPGGDRLVAYVVWQTDAAPDVGELRRWMAKELPDYMIPSAYVPLDALPLLPNGKIDRNALPAPAPTRPELERPFVPPESPIEQELADAWAAVLGLDRVGRHDNFFDLGGHSLLATQVVARIRDVFDIEFPLAAFFEAPTVAELAVAVVVRIVEDDSQTGPHEPHVEHFVTELMQETDPAEAGAP